MEQWQLWAISGAILVVIEIFTPALLFINFALASFTVAIISTYTNDLYILLPLWTALSAIFLVFLRPWLLKRNPDKNNTTGISKYIGQQAKVLEDISENSGVISIYDERWNARSSTQENISVGTTVIIEKYENLTMYVKQEK